jgi:uncharacterized protein (DUF2147 family)
MFQAEIREDFEMNTFRMKRFALAAGLALLGMPAMAAGISGVFQTAPNDDGNVAQVEFTACGAAFCGEMIRSFSSDGEAIASDNIGKNIVWDMMDQGDGYFKGGRIWDPGKDKTYKSKMTLMGDTLQVKGCIGPFCKAQTWTRLD